MSQRYTIIECDDGTTDVVPVTSLPSGRPPPSPTFLEAAEAWQHVLNTLYGKRREIDEAISHARAKLGERK